MYAISNWARHHVKAARLLITLLHIYLFGASWWIARQVPALAALHPVLIAVLLLALVWATAPEKNCIAGRRWRFRVQKTRFIVTGIGCLLLLTAFFSSDNAIRYELYGPLNGAYIESSGKKEKPDWNTYTDSKKYSEDLKAYFGNLSKKELRKELRHQLKSLREGSSGSQTALAVLVALLAVIGVMFIAALACGIACNGNDALALVVLIGGTAGLFAIAYVLIRKIKRGKKTPVAQPNPTTSPSSTSSK